MNIAIALSTITNAIKIAKDLREVERGLDTATYKSKMAELYEGLADVKMALTDAKEAIYEKDKEIRKLNEQIESLRSGENCPICDIGRMKVVSSRPHPQFAFAGVQERTVKCQNEECSHSEKRIYDPENRTGRK